MDSRSKYKTRHREVILDYFVKMPGIHITAGEVYKGLKDRGVSIGQSTVYRQLESLVEEGILNKYIIDENSPACFEFEEEDNHCHKEIFFHCKCESCGKLIHLQCDEIEEIEEHLIKEHKFFMDPKRTVFYGLCEACQK